MAWFKRKPKDPPPIERPSLCVLLTDLPKFEPKALAAKLAAIEPLRLYPKLKFDVAEKDVLHGHAEFDSHVVRIAGFHAPLPESVMAMTIDTSAWQGEVREEMKSHKAHLLLFHEGGGKDVPERMIALYKLAAVLGGESLLGVVHEGGWTCAPKGIVRDFLDANELVMMREGLPPVIFWGFMPFRGEEETWYATKGGHVFGVPDLVVRGSGEGNSEMMALFHNIFLYMVRVKRIEHGHTMQLGDELFLKFETLPPDHPHHDYLSGKDKTLLIKRITKDQVTLGNP
ncbi:MAG: hypothetical protein KF696_15810 [Planctomycetes bacterium]|nr:hypothetical protein [Planctomycetota bacterium]MCW8136226.1 hypothetical protein [Planctomycetota bacterium]